MWMIREAECYVQIRGQIERDVQILSFDPCSASTRDAIRLIVKW